MLETQRDQTKLDGVRDEQLERKPRIGIIGLGYWGPKLARNFQSLECSTLEMVADLRQERLDEIKKIFPGVKVTTDYRSLLESDVDAVVVATPVHTHFDLAKEALLAGKHVLVEKPLTSRAAEGRDLLNIAKKNNCLLMVGHTFLYNPAVIKVRELIQAGELGQIYYINCTRVNLGLLQPDINVMWDLAPHDLSILNFILEDEPMKASAIGSVYINGTSKLPEVIYLNLRYRNEVLANLRLSWLDPVKTRRITIVGSKRMLVYDDIADDKVVIYDKGVEVPPYSLTEEEFRASYRDGAGEVIPIKWTEPLRIECEHFVECVRSGKRPISDGETGLKIVKILETAQRSLINGGHELTIEY